MTTIPTAEVIAHRYKKCRIRCPYCRGSHDHQSGTNPFVPGSTHHRAPGCGLTLTGEQRAAGYQFTIPTN